MAKKLQDILNITPEFLKEYEGANIVHGGTVYNVAEGKITETPYPKSGVGGGLTISSDFMADTGQYAGLQPRGRGSYDTKELWRYFKPEYTPKEFQSNYVNPNNNIDIGPRGENEDMASYLMRKQAAGSNAVLGNPATDLAKAVAQNPADMKIASVANEPISATKYYKDGKEIDPTKYINEAPGSEAFNNYLKNQGITTKAPESSTAVDLTPGKVDDTNIQKSDEMTKSEERIKKAYDNFVANKLNPNQVKLSGNSGQDFITQAAMASKGRKPTSEELANLKTVGEVLDHFGLTNRMSDGGTSTMMPVDRDLTKEQEAGRKISEQFKGQDFNDPKVKDAYFKAINKAVYGTENPTFTTKQGVKQEGTGNEKGGETEGTGANAKPNPTISTFDPNTNQDIIDKKAFGTKLEAELKVIQDAETAAKTKLTNFQTSYQLGQQAIEDQPIPMKAIIGQQTSLQRTAAIQEANLIAKLGIVQDEKAGVIDRANLQLQIDDRIYKIKKDVITQAQAYRKDQQDALATVISLFPNGVDKMTPEITKLITNVAKDTGIDAGLIIDALTTKRLDYDASELQKNQNKFQFISATANQPSGIFDPDTGKFIQNKIEEDLSGLSVTDIADAIKQVESDGDYQAQGASGEFGAYQFMPETWNSWSSDYANNVLKMSMAKLEPTPENQDAVAQWKIQQWSNQGLSPQQIAAKWNSGSEVGWENKIGTNEKGVDYNVPAYVNKVSNILSSKKTSENQFTPEFYATDYGQKVLNNEQQYYTNFLSNQTVKDFVATQNKAASISKIIDIGVGGPGDLALVFEFMKGLDPSSVVRESEYDTAAKSGNIFQGVYTKFNGYFKKTGGILPENVKKAFRDIVQAKLDISQQTYNQLRDQARQTAKEQGLNPNHVAPDLTIDFKSEQYPSGTIIEVDGRTYKSLGNNQFEEIR